MPRTANRRIGNKFSGLLSGVLAGLYEGSSAQVNPDFDNPGGHDFTDASFDANTVQPYMSGGGAFGKVKAHEQNLAFDANNRLAQLMSERQMANKLKMMPFELQQEKDILKAKSDIEQDTANTLLGQQGSQFFDYASQLPEDQLNVVSPGGLGQLPPTMADVGRFKVSRYGQTTPFVEIPNIAQTEANKFKISSDPRTLTALQSKAMGEGLVNIGGNTHINLADKTAYQGAHRETITTQVPTGKYQMTLNPDTNELERTEIMQTVQIPKYTEPSISNLRDLRMTQADVDAAADFPSGDFSNQLGIVPQFNTSQPQPITTPRVTSKPVTEARVTSPDYYKKGAPITDVSSIFTPMNQEMAAEEHKRRLIKKLQTHAWNPVNWGMVNPY